MSDESVSTIMIGRIETGYFIHVVGRGTCRESAALEQFATQAFLAENCAVTIDLFGCDHLDSTFLGCLVTLHKRFGVGHPSRFVVAASPEKVQKLLTPSKLDKFLEITDRSPRIKDTLMILPESKVDQLQMGRHVMECHRLLADLGGPNAASFAAIADQIGRELAAEQAATVKSHSGP